MEEFETMVGLIHGFQIGGAQAQIEQKKAELAATEKRLEALRNDDSASRRLAKEIMDLTSQVSK